MHGGNAAPRRPRRWGVLTLLLIAGTALLLATLGAHAARPRSSAPGSAAAPAAPTGPARPANGPLINSLPAGARALAAESPQGPYRLGQVLLGFRSGVSAARELAIERVVGASSASRVGPPIKPVGHGRTTGQEYLAPMELRVPDTRVLPVVQRLKRFSEVAYAEPNYLQQGAATSPNKPNDPEFPKQWGDENTGQKIPKQSIPGEVLEEEVSGTAAADDRASLAWSVTTGSRNVVIGEVDTGVAYEHPDLKENIWTNPGGLSGAAGECPKGTHGYNVIAKTCNPIDEDKTYNGHGTHVAGILGAVGGNGIGVAGMNWQTTILPVRWLNEASSGNTGDLVNALLWLVAAKQAGVNVRVVNDSDVFTGKTGSEQLKNAIETLAANNILFVTAAGNTGQNNNEEAVQRFPCSYDLPNEICVTASNNNDQLPTWANYGTKTVQLAAPGQSIYSTFRGNTYGYLSGGSMASPQVAGAAALILSVSPSLSATQLRADILNNVDKLPAFEKVETGGRLDVCKALPGCTPATEPTTFGKTSIGASSDTFASERKRVNRYALPTNGSVTKLSVYLAPTATAGQQVMKGVIYSDVGGKPEKLLGVSEPLTFKHENAAGWYQLPFASPVGLSAGTYWIGVTTGPTNSVAGFKWDSVSNSRDYNANTYSSGPTNPFGAVTTDSEQTSLYATYIAAPVNTLAPTITGEARQGQTLTEHHGSWTNEPSSFTYKWEQCNSEGGVCAPITGATKQTYEIAPGDVGHKLKVIETATNAAGSGEAAASTTEVVKPLPPKNKTAPTIEGKAQQGQTLTEVHGTWDNNPASFTYQWQQCTSEGTGCANITGATKQTYEVAPGDVGHKLKVVETAINAGGSGEAPSAASALVTSPAPSGGVPTITGEARQGQTLTEVHGKWTNEPTSFTYKWEQCTSEGTACAPITGATKQTYEIAPGDVGHKLRVIETATNAGGSGEAPSSATAVVLPLAPTGGVPTITGEARQGQTLTDVHGTWANNPTSFAYKWEQCNSEGGSCAPITGATKQTYEVAPGDVGHKLRVVETATNAGGSGEAPSTPTAVVLPLAPTGGVPTISGEARQGQTLTEVHGTWANSPTSFSYKWEQCTSEGTACAPITGATKQTYEVAPGDVGHKLKVIETATNAGGSGEAPSTATAVVLPLAPSGGVPTIEGKAQQGQTLTEVHGTWANNPTSFSYKWEQCNSEGGSCAPITGATKQTYEIAPGDVGHTLRVLETATNAGGSGGPTPSAATAVVTAPVPVAEKGFPPTIIDPAQQGQTLTEAHGKWTNSPTSFTYQWLQCNSEGTLPCAPISGATKQTYEAMAGDVGHRLRVQETASNAAGPSEPATSEATAVVLPLPPVNEKAPAITGTVQQGQTLTEVHGKWSNNPTGFTYQWLQCNSEGTLPCAPISGATKQTYEPAVGDVGHRLRVQETASNAGGSSKEPATSEPTAIVTPPAPVNEKPPTITGEARQGQTLTDVHGTWSNSPTSFSYKWEQCTSEGTACAPITGATKQTYEIAPGDVGHKLRVIETATNAGGSGEAPSTPTAVVLPLAPTGGVPTISGEARQGQTLTDVHGTWANNPTSFAYKWEQCTSEGTACAPITGATKQTYEIAPGDVGHKLKVIETATNAGGSGEAPSSATAVVLPLAPTGGVPTITGEARQGQTLTEVHGTWANSPTSFAYKWEQCNSEGGGCAAIASATKQTYEVAPGDAGHTLRVIETASNAGGSGEAPSTPTAVVLPLAPAGGVPTITGEARQGQTLTEVHGTWANSPTSFAYKWEQCNSEGGVCEPITGATKQTYEIAPGDVGHKLRVIETATNAGGSGEAPSTPTAVVLPPAPLNTVAPTISGEARQGQTLTDVHGTWTNNPTGFTYQWLQCEGATCTPISGAKAQEYVPVEADVGHTLKVEETASNAGGAGKPATSAATEVVVPPPPANVSKPTITGTAQGGQTLTEHNGTWTNSPTGFKYQWEQCEALGSGCLPITGATKPTYVVQPADVGGTIRVQETASNAGGPGSPATSEPTSVVIPEGGLVPSPENQPTITGEARQGQTLTEQPASWKNGPTSFSYQWLQCNSEGTLPCTPISGAIKQEYVPVEGDVGHRLRVQETAGNSFGESSPDVSEPTAVVVPPVPTMVKAPSITGEARQGQTLLEHHGEWTNNPTGFTYQWVQCNPSNVCTPISGAKAQEYVPVEADVGHTLKVEETASNAGGPGAPAVSEATGAIKQAVPTIIKAPTITGEARQGKPLTEHHGEWTNNPTGFSYQWLQCEGATCTPISGAKAQEYTPVEADVGHTLKVEETASNSGGPGAPAASEATEAIKQAVPTIIKAPSITGEARQGQTLAEHHGEWTNNPTGFTYQWLQCEGATCTPISGAKAQEYVPVEGDVGHTLKVEETASNAGGAGKAAVSEATEVIKQAVPTIIKVPTITGEARQGKPLAEHHGEWTNNPTGFSYQWLHCEGATCTPISGAKAQEYVPVETDVGHTIKVEETASNSGGSSKPAASEPIAIEPGVPVNETPPTITGTPQQGQPLTEVHGKWTDEPTGFAYQWLQCEGSTCAPIFGANKAEYVPVEADVGHTIKVEETASNAGGPGKSAISAATAAVKGTFGKTNVGASVDLFAGGRKRVNRYALPLAGAVTKLSIYLQPTKTAGQQVMKGVIYADEGGSPTALLGTTEQITFHSTNSAGWYEMKFASPVKLAAGNYWIGELTGLTANVAAFRYDSVAGSRDFNANVYKSGPSNPFGAFSADAEQTSLYATYTPGG